MFYAYANKQRRAKIATGKREGIDVRRDAYCSDTELQKRASMEGIQNSNL